MPCASKVSCALQVTYLTSLLVEQHGQSEEELTIMLEQIEEDALGGETQTRDAEGGHPA